MRGVDLSGWRLALNGAEPIDPQTMARFQQRFARWGFRAEAMTPGYGLAEAGLAVSFSDLRAEPLVTEFDRRALSEENRAVSGSGRSLVSVGTALPGVDMEIWDETDRPAPPGFVGKIMVRGPSITKGYFNDLPTTEQTFRNGWLDTGDLGFVHDGNLYITGRLKDLIIIRGRNYAPQEFEELLKMDGVLPESVVAVGHQFEEVGEQLIILAEKDSRSSRSEEEIVEAIRARVVSGLALNPYHVQMLEPGTLPRTSSGKLRRGEALRLFLAGALAPPEKMSAFRLLQEVGKSQLAWARFWLRTRGSQ
jgi:acyl-CoA synthetase (AMP-forming)/AMP-acid ligase II